MQKALCSWHLQDFEMVIADTGKVIKLEGDNTSALELRGNP
jgi:hypothetical protein